MNDTSNVNTDKLVSDLKTVMRDAEELLKLTAGQAGEKLDTVRGRLGERLQKAQGQLVELEHAALDRTREVAKVTDNYVRDHPWRAVGTAAGVAFLVGLLIGRR